MENLSLEMIYGVWTLVPCPWITFCTFGTPRYMHVYMAKD